MTSAERAAILIQQVGFDCENRRVAETIAAAAIDAAVAEAKTQCESAMRAGLGMASGESLGDWLKRMQDAVNQQRERAVAEERERIAALAEEVEATYETRDYADPEAKAKGGYASSYHNFAELIRGGRDADTQPTV